MFVPSLRFRLVRTASSRLVQRVSRGPASSLEKSLAKVHLRVVTTAAVLSGAVLLTTACSDPPPPPPAEILAHRDLAGLREALTEPYRVPEAEHAELTQAFHTVVLQAQAPAAPSPSTQPASAQPAASASGAMQSASNEDRDGGDTRAPASTVPSESDQPFWTVFADPYQNWAHGYGPIPPALAQDAAAFGEELAMDDTVAEMLREFVLGDPNPNAACDHAAATPNACQIGALFFARVVGGGNPKGKVEESPVDALASDLEILLDEARDRQHRWSGDAFPKTAAAFKQIADCVSGANPPRPPADVPTFVESVRKGLAEGISTDPPTLSPFQDEQAIDTFLATIGEAFLRSKSRDEASRRAAEAFVITRAYAPQAMLCVKLHELARSQDQRPLAQALKAYQNRYGLEVSEVSLEGAVQWACKDRSKWDDWMWPVRAVGRIAQEPLGEASPASTANSVGRRPAPSGEAAGTASSVRSNRGSGSDRQGTDGGSADRAPAPPDRGVDRGNIADADSSLDRGAASRTPATPGWASDVANALLKVVLDEAENGDTTGLKSLETISAVRFEIVPAEDAASGLLGEPTNAWRIQVVLDQAADSTLPPRPRTLSLPLVQVPRLWKLVEPHLVRQRDQRLAVLAASSDQVKDFLRIPRASWWSWTTDGELVRGPAVTEALEEMAEAYRVLVRQQALDARMVLGTPALVADRLPQTGERVFDADRTLPPGLDLGQVAEQIRAATPYWLGTLQRLGASGDVLRLEWQSPFLGRVAVSAAVEAEEKLWSSLAEAVKARVNLGIRSGGEVAIPHIGWLRFEVDDTVTEGLPDALAVEGETFERLALRGRGTLILKAFPSRAPVEFVARGGVEPALEVRVARDRQGTRLPQLLGALAGTAGEIVEFRVPWGQSAVEVDGQRIAVTADGVLNRGETLTFDGLCSVLTEAMADRQDSVRGMAGSAVESLSDLARAGTMIGVPLGAGGGTLAARIERAAIDATGSDSLSLRVVVSTQMDSATSERRVELPLILSFSREGGLWRPTGLMLSGPRDWIVRAGGDVFPLDAGGLLKFLSIESGDSSGWTSDSGIGWHELWRRGRAAAGNAQALKWTVRTLVGELRLSLDAEGLTLSPDLDTIRTKGLDWINASVVKPAIDRILKQGELAQRLPCVTFSNPSLTSRVSDREDDLIANIDFSAVATLGDDLEVPIAIATEIRVSASDVGGTRQFQIDRSRLDLLVDGLASSIRQNIRDAVVGMTFDNVAIDGVRWSSGDGCPELQWVASEVKDGVRRITGSMRTALGDSSLADVAKKVGEEASQLRERVQQVAEQVAEGRDAAVQSLNRMSRPLCAEVSLEGTDLVVRSTIEGDGDKELIRVAWSGQSDPANEIKNAVVAHSVNCIRNSDMATLVEKRVRDALSTAGEKVKESAEEALQLINASVGKVCAIAAIEGGDLVVRSTIEGDGNKQLIRRPWAERGGVDVKELARALAPHAVSCAAGSDLVREIKKELAQSIATAATSVTDAGRRGLETLNEKLGPLCLIVRGKADGSTGAIEIVWVGRVSDTVAEPQEVVLFEGQPDRDADYGYRLARHRGASDKVLTGYVNQCLLGDIELPDWVCPPSIEGQDLVGKVRLPLWPGNDCGCSAAVSDDNECVTITVRWPILSAETPSVHVEGALRRSFSIEAGVVKATAELEVESDGLARLALDAIQKRNAQAGVSTRSDEGGSDGIAIATGRLLANVKGLGDVPPVEVTLVLEDGSIKLEGDVDWKQALCTQLENLINEKLAKGLSKITLAGGTLEVEVENCSDVTATLTNASLAGVIDSVTAQVEGTIDSRGFTMTEWQLSGDATLLGAVEITGLSGGYGAKGWSIGAERIVLIESAVELGAIKVSVGDPIGLSASLRAFGAPAGGAGIELHRGERRLVMMADLDMAQVARVRGSLDVVLRGPVLDLEGAGEISNVEVGSARVLLDQPQKLYGGGGSLTYLGVTAEADMVVKLSTPKDVRVGLGVGFSGISVDTLVDRGGVDLTAGAFGLTVTLVFRDLDIDKEEIQNLFLNLFDPRRWLDGLMNISIPVRINLFASGPGGGGGRNSKNSFAGGEGEGLWEFEVKGGDLWLHRRGMESAKFGEWNLQRCGDDESQQESGSVSERNLQENLRGYLPGVLSSTDAPNEVDAIQFTSTANAAEIWIVTKACDSDAEGVSRIESPRGSQEAPTQLFATLLTPKKRTEPGPGPQPPNRPLPPWPDSGRGGALRKFGEVVRRNGDDVSLSVFRVENGRMVGAPLWTATAPLKGLMMDLVTRFERSDPDTEGGVATFLQDGASGSSMVFVPAGTQPRGGNEQAGPDEVLIAVDIDDIKDSSTSWRRVLWRAVRASETLEFLGIPSADGSLLLAAVNPGGRETCELQISLVETGRPLRTVGPVLTTIDPWDSGVDRLISGVCPQRVPAEASAGNKVEAVEIHFGGATGSRLLYVPLPDGDPQFEMPPPG